ncbi:MAG TPA: hypothetical protein VMF58_12235 [Rhizomicrobium sp.]|nr:hypothetical protein [Rhizomicrobium sp.]
MSRLNQIPGAFIAVVAVALALASPACAQATRTWVSGVGDDANPCSRTAPCHTFAGAISKTATGGEIDVLDPGGFGAVTITKSITIASEGAGEGGVAASGTFGITVNCVSDPNCNVVLRRLQIDGAPPSSPGLIGIRFILGKNLIIEDCQIRNFVGGSPNGYGVTVTPSSGTQTVVIQGTTINNNGSASAGGGVFVAPTGSASVNIALNNDVLANNYFGFRADSSGTTGTITGSVSNSQVTNNTFAGVAAVGNTTASQISVKHSTLMGNGIGVNANGGSSLIALTLDDSEIAYNPVGYKQQNSAAINTLHNNAIHDNPSNVGTLTTLGPS